MNSSLEEIINKYVPEPELSRAKSILYGKSCKEITLELKLNNIKSDFDFRAYSFVDAAKKESTKERRIVRIGLLQFSIVLPTDKLINAQREAMYYKIGEYVETAKDCGINILCLPETWTMPYAFCTREKYPWVEFAEDIETGPTTKFISKIAEKYKMVIISPIMERDSIHGETLWNTAVVIDVDGKVLGKQRKNHIPRLSNSNESNYFMEGNTGHPVFDTCYGRIAINICYGRHHPMNWAMFGINGAEIVFNPCASSGSSESTWFVQSLSAAFTNNFFTCSVNRVGVEKFPNEFTSGNGKPGQRESGHYYGSSYVATPEGNRTPGLSRDKDGLLVVEVDLNLCKQAKDYQGFTMTRRLEMYAEKFREATQPDFKPQIKKSDK